MKVRSGSLSFGAIVWTQMQIAFSIALRLIGGGFSRKGAKPPNLSRSGGRLIPNSSHLKPQSIASQYVYGFNFASLRLCVTLI